jgi:DNA-binding GntR family transcriptional regulator
MSAPVDDDHAPLDPRGRRPMYIVLAARLERRIKAGEFGESGRLPTRVELAEQYGAGRATIRRAVRLLEEAGLIEVVPWGGTFTL